MKRLLLLCSFVLLTNLASAQQEINYDFTNKMNALFGQLDKSKIPNGILLDYGMEFTNLEEFDGTLTNRNYVTLGRLEEVYKTLLTSKINPNTNSLVNPTVFKNNLKNNRTKGTIAIGGLFYNYTKFKDDALIRNRVSYSNGKFYDIANQNPYETKQTFVMSPAIQKYSGLAMQVKIPSAIFYSNTNNQVQSIHIDFGNGNGYVTVPFNQTMGVAYTVEGIKTWKYKLNLTNGTSLYSHSKIKIDKGYTTVAYGSQNYQRTTSNNTNVYQSQRITAGDSYLGQKASVNLTIDLANGHDQITKPLIVAEGFDVGVILSPENEYGYSGYSEFRTSLNDSGELYDLIRGYNKEYDIIYIDWDNGVDYLQRNAYALEEVIKWVNQKKAIAGSNEQNVVLGQSMGGVIARYALADMEERGMNHDTRLFISHDAPQQGANVPIAVQYMYRHVQNQFINTIGGVLVSLFTDIEEPFKLLDTPAARQLLKNRAVYNYGLNNTLHNSFYNELKNKGLNGSSGYPINSRNIAVSNGSECGDTQGFVAGDYLLQYQDSNKLSFIQNIIAPFASFLGGILLNDIDLSGITMLTLFPGSSKYTTDFWAKSIPYGNGSQIYKGKISYTKKILWLISVTTNITNVNKNKPSGMLPFDSYGGGYYATTNSDISLPDGVYLRDKFNFIPTSSALDIGKNNVNLNDSDYLRSYVGGNPPTGTKSSPFVNFSTDFDTNPNIHNKPHISFNPRNGDWLADELEETTSVTDCSAFCSGSNAIIGEEILCETGNYYVNTSYDVNWSISEGAHLVEIVSTSSNAIMLRRLNSTASGHIKISGAIGSASNECGITSFSKNVEVKVKPQKSKMRFNRYQSYNFQNNRWNLLGVYYNGQLDIDKYTWEFQVPSSMVRHSPNQSYINFRPNVNSSTQIYIKARASNECGCSDWLGQSFNVVYRNNDPCEDSRGLPCADDIIEY